MTFRIGQKVVCVDASVHGPDSIRLCKGAIYTVGDIDPARDRFDEIGLIVCEIEMKRHNGWSASFRASRFRPVVERKTDISIFTEILRKASKPARGPVVTSPQRVTP